jgi:hypothetical protein
VSFHQPSPGVAHSDWFRKCRLVRDAEFAQGRVVFRGGLVRTIFEVTGLPVVKLSCQSGLDVLELQQFIKRSAFQREERIESSRGFCRR